MRLQTYIFLGVLVPVLLVEAYWQFLLTDALETQMVNQLSAVADARGRAINDLMNDYLRDIELLSTNPQLIKVLRSSPSSVESSGTIEALLENMFRTQLAAFLGAAVLDNRGELVALRGRIISDDLEPARAALQSTLISPRMSHPFITSQNLLATRLVAPVMGEGDVLGSVVVTLYMHHFLEITEDYHGLGETGEIALVRLLSSGKLAILTPLRFDGSAHLGPFQRVSSMDDPFLQAATASTGTLMAARDYRGQAVFAVTRFLDAAEWGLVVKIDSAEVTAPIQKRVWLAALVIFMVLIPFSWLVARRISRPIRQLKSVAQAMGEQAYSTRAIQAGPFEVKQLAASFNTMADTVERAATRDNAYARALEKTNDALQDTHAKLMHTAKIATFGEVSVSLAHEMSQPLAAIQGMSQVLLVDPNMPRDLTDALNVITRATSQLSAVVENVREYARRGESVLQELAPVEPLNAALELMERQLKVLAIAVQLDIDFGDHVIRGDKSALQQVFLNLLTNARDALADTQQHPTPCVQISAAKLKDSIRFAVEDNGHGVPMRLRERMFETYFTTKDSGSGTGLGLGIVQSIVQAHGGTLSYFESPLGGAGFEILLPLSQIEKKSLPAPAASTSPMNVDLTSLTALVVDDDEIVCYVVQRIFKTLGVSVRGATSSSEALRLIAEDAPDVLITDIQLQGESGVELAAEVRKRWPMTAVALTSGASLLEATGAMERSGAVGFFAKPMHLEDVRYLLQQVAAGAATTAVVKPLAHES